MLQGPIAQRHRLAVLALLASAPDCVSSRDRILGIIWPETSTPKARQLLNSSVHVIRKRLGDGAIRTEGEVLRLSLTAMRVDVVEFETALRIGDARTAVNSYNGSFCDGLSIPGSVEFDQWQQRESTRLQQQYFTALEQLAEAAPSEPGERGSAHWWRQRLDCTPDNGRVALRLMMALAAIGDRASAFRVAAEHAELLRVEYGAVVDEAVREFADHLRLTTGIPRDASSAGMLRNEISRQHPSPAAFEFHHDSSHPRVGKRFVTLTIVGATLAGLGIVWNVVSTDGDARAVVAHDGASAVVPAAHSAWVKARFHLQKRTISDLKSCVQFADEAIRMDPRFPSGHAVRSACLFNQAFLGSAPSLAALNAAETSARRAIALDPRHAGAHVSLGWVTAARDWNWMAAENYFRRAIELDPGFDFARSDYGHFLAWRRQFDEALVEVREAERLSPTVPIMAHHVAYALYLARRYDDAIQQARHALTLDSTFFISYQTLALAYSAAGQHEKAVAAMEKALHLTNNDAPQRLLLGYVYARSGRLTEALEIVGEMELTAESVFVSPAAISLLYVGLGDRERALLWLTRGIENRDAYLVQLDALPQFDPLRGDPRFERALALMGF